MTTGGFISTELRVNDRIRVPEVRLVGPAGEQVGIVRIEDALRLAAEADLDLVEVAPAARPPVCRLMDYGKFKYEAAQKAIKWIEGLTKDVEVGKEYLGKVTRIMNFGAFVEILPGKEGLVHISQLADYRVPRVEDVVSIGDELMVIVTEIDRMGRVNLSRRAAMERHMAKAGAGSNDRS